MDERMGFSFLRSYYEAAKQLPTEGQAHFLMAVCAYALDGVEPEVNGVASAMFLLVKPNIDISIKRFEAGKRGGESKKKANVKQNRSKTETNESNNTANTENIEDMINDKGYMINDKGYMRTNAEQTESKTETNEKQIESKSKPKRKQKNEEPRHRYGEYQNVLLSDSDMMKLQAEFPNDWQSRIERVSGYCKQYGKSYSDYLATIRNWDRRDKERAEKEKTEKAANRSTPLWNNAKMGYEGAMKNLDGLIDE